MRPPPVAPLEVHLPATAGSVTTARHAVARFSAGRALDDGGIALAVSEAVANAVVHAYPDPAHGEVHLHVSLDGATLVVVVSDDGQGMNHASDGGGMGAGLDMIARTCNSLRIDGDGGGTTLTMRFIRSG